MQQPIQTFAYRLKPDQLPVYPGAHPGKMSGCGFSFQNSLPLMAHPDPRRLDLRASLLDPFEAYRVKVYRQPNKIAVYVIADLSASMAYAGDAHSLQFLLDLTASVAQSAIDNGDRFGFIGCGDKPYLKTLLPPSAAMPPVWRFLERLKTEKPSGGSGFFTETAALLPAQKSLLFLVSDYHLPLERIRDLLSRLARHAVTPIVSWDAADYTALPDWGIIRVKDAETGRCRILCLRPQLKAKILDAYARRQQLLQHTFSSFGLRPLFMQRDYRIGKLADYFQAHAL